MSEDPAKKKQRIREHFLEVRKNLTSAFVKEKSHEILKSVSELNEFRDANNVHTYVSIKKNKEVDTFPLIEKCFRDNKHVIVPKIRENGQLKHFRLRTLGQLQVNDWGVMEPVEGEIVPVSDLDVVIVPMVAGDPKKNRLGYGKGYYDRFLNNCVATKIGLLFDCQLYESELPVEPFDVPLDYLVTESRQID